MSKQDRQGARTPADLERKYNFGKSFAVVMGIAEDAQTAVKELDEKLNQDEIFNRLTNNGAAQGLFRNGTDIYVNTKYLFSDELVAVDIIAKALNAINDDGDYVKVQDGQIIAGNTNESEAESFALRRDQNQNGVFSLEFNNLNEDGERVHGSMKYDQLSLGAVERAEAPFSVKASASTNVDRSNVKLRLPDAADHYAVREKELYVYWKDNGDGTFSIVGYENELQ